MKLSQVEPEQLEQFSKEQLVRIVLQQRAELEALGKVLPTAGANDTKLGLCPMDFLLAQKDQYPELFLGTGQLKQMKIEDLFPSSCVEKLTQSGLRMDYERLIQQVFAIEQLRLERAIRDTLRHLGDISYMNHCLLLDIARTRQAELDGADLRGKLIGAINSVKPKQKADVNHQRQKMRYDILRLTYLSRKSLQETISLLSISERQYYRELKVAVRTVLEHLFRL